MSLRNERVDGRIARSERSRARVADAMITLYERGDLRPTAARIAEVAGVSLRLVHHHFKDRDALFEAAADRQNEGTWRLVRAVPTTGPFRTRLRAFCSERARLLETITPVRRAAVVEAPFSRAVAGRLRVFRKLKREQVTRVFATELAAVPSRRRDAIAAAACTAASWSAWEDMRAFQGLDVETARAALQRTLAALLERN